jgi:uncharacterized protein YabE (DUF348 family)
VRHPFRRKSLPLFVLYFAIVLVVGGGTAAYGVLNKTVTLEVEGREATIRTFGGTVSDVLEAKDITVRPSDKVSHAPTEELSDGDTIEVAYAKPLTLTLDGKVSQHTVYDRTVGSVLDELGVDTTAQDYVSAKPSTRVPRSGTELVVSTQKQLTVVADGKKIPVSTTAPTVAGVLEDAKVTVDDDDEVKPGTDALVVADATVKVVRIEKVDKTEDVDMKFGVDVREDPEAMKGEEVVVTKGEKGLTREKVTLVMADGKVRERIVHSSEVVKKPVNQVESHGTSTTPPDSVWDKIAQCESGGNWSINTGNGYYGGLQFSAATWRSVGGPGLPHENSRETQIKYAEILQSRAGWGQWGCAHARFD